MAEASKEQSLSSMQTGNFIRNISTAQLGSTNVHDCLGVILSDQLAAVLCVNKKGGDSILRQDCFELASVFTPCQK